LPRIQEPYNITFTLEQLRPVERAGIDLAGTFTATVINAASRR
jgi:hypothetical protein